MFSVRIDAEILESEYFHVQVSWDAFLHLCLSVLGTLLTLPIKCHGIQVEFKLDSKGNKSFPNPRNSL